mmetsp:Transcript_60294/g.179604  ORF Transcript_60294/g.179604 Transcript_60294/m.179604 type:complete len:279 (+) Transcript_60294:308-1144(+)
MMSSPNPFGGFFFWMMRLQASALVRSTTRARATSWDHQLMNSGKDTIPSRETSTSAMSASMSRWIPSSERAFCSSAGQMLPPASPSILSKIIRSCGFDRECSAWSPFKMLLSDRRTCSVTSSTSEHSATPRMTEPSLGSTTETAPLFIIFLVPCRDGGNTSGKPLIPAVRPVGMRIILSTATVFAMSQMCLSTRVAHFSKSGVPGCGGVNFEPTIQPDIASEIEACHLEVKIAFSGEFRTRLPLLKSTAPMCLPMVQMSTSWPRHMASSEHCPKTSSS